MIAALKIPWPKLPFIRLLLPTVAGIMLQRFWTIGLDISMVLFLLFTISFAISEFGYFPFRYRWIRGAFIHGSFFFLACVIWTVRSPEQQRSAYIHSLTEESILHVAISERPVEKKNSYKVLVEVEQVVNGSIAQRTQGKAILYFEKCEQIALIIPGDVLQINARSSPHNDLLNPGQFDYGKYLMDKGVLRTAYVRKHEWVSTDVRSTNLVGLIRDLRARLIEMLRQGDLSGPEGQIATALVLGYKEDLDPELKRSFSEAGAMHVLAVSGLHVGIIFMALSFMLKWMERRRYGKFIKTILVILLIWFYAMLTGFSPSVFRATVMFTVIGSAGLFNKQANIFNTLAASAFIMLLFDPRLLFNVGFQLSYSAVIGIVALYPKLSPLVTSRYWLVNKVWDLTAVSIAAQIATFPLTLLYFHQIPIYSVLSNLVIIPAAFAIIALGGAYLLSSWVDPLALVISKVLWAVLWATNGIMELISDLPKPVLIFELIGQVEAIMIYGMIFGISMFIIHKVKPALVFFISCSAFFIGLFLLKDINAGTQSEMVFFNKRKGVLFAEVHGRKMTIYGDKRSYDDPYTERTINDAKRVCRAQIVELKTLEFHPNTTSLELDWRGNSISIPLSDNPSVMNSKIFPVDLVVISGAFPFWKSAEFEKSLEEDGQFYHSIINDGLLIID